MTRTARCCCGECSITVEGEPSLNAICNCTSCRKRTGSAFGWSSYFPDDKIVAKRGVMNIYSRQGDAGYQRSFCANCGTTLYWKSFGFLPDQTGIAGGCFVETPLPAPVFSSQDSDRCAWIGLPEAMGRAG
jgi:hypothetical protein